MNINVVKHDFAPLQDAFMMNDRPTLKTGLDAVRQSFSPGVVVALVLKDSKTGAEGLVKEFGNVQEFDAWRVRFEIAPDTTDITEHLKGQYKDFKW